MDNYTTRRMCIYQRMAEAQGIIGQRDTMQVNEFMMKLAI